MVITNSREFNLTAPFTGALSVIEWTPLPEPLARGGSASQLEQGWLRPLLGIESNPSLPYPRTCFLLRWFGWQLQISCNETTHLCFNFPSVSAWLVGKEREEEGEGEVEEETALQAKGW